MQYAVPGVTLFLSGRREEALENVASHCRKRGAEVHYQRLDVLDQEAMESWIIACFNIRPLDMVIANAGISGGISGGDEPMETRKAARKIFDVNLMGVLNTVHPALACMEKHGGGQIAIISSLAGINSMPGAPAYSASKAAIRYYGEALRPSCARDNIYISVVCPGFIRTPMTDVNPFPMPFMMEADAAAAYICRQLSKRKITIFFPFRLYVAVMALHLLPLRLRLYLLSKLPAKPALE